MALVNCPECGREGVSSTAVACPSCGFNVKAYFENIDSGNVQKEDSVPEKNRLFESVNDYNSVEKRADAVAKKSGNKVKALLWILVLIFILIVIGTIPSIISHVEMNKPLELTGLSQTEALNTLEKRGYAHKVEYMFSNEIEKEHVISQKEYPEQKFMILTVSNGQFNFVPKLVGQKADSLDLGDIKYKIEDGYSDKYSEGIIYEMSHEEGSKIGVDETLIIYVCRGKLYPISVLGMTPEEVKEKYSDLGLYFTAKYVYNETYEEGVICEEIKEKVHSGQKIQLSISKGSGVMVPVAQATEKETLKALSQAGFKNVEVRYEYPSLDKVDCTNPEETVNVAPVGRVDNTDVKVIVTVKKAAIVFTKVDWNKDFLDGIGLTIVFKNTSDKQIAYATFTVAFYDRMGNPAYDEMSVGKTYKKKVKYTGPLDPGKTNNKNNYDAGALYNGSVAAVSPKEVIIEFTDGTKQTLTLSGRYWYSDDYYGGALHDD